MHIVRKKTKQNRKLQIAVQRKVKQAEALASWSRTATYQLENPGKVSSFLCASPTLLVFLNFFPDSVIETFSLMPGLPHH